MHLWTNWILFDTYRDCLERGVWGKVFDANDAYLDEGQHSTA